MDHRSPQRTHLRFRSSRTLLSLSVSILGLLSLAVLLMGLMIQPQTAEDQPVLLFGIGVHIEPFGAQVSSIAIEAGAWPRTLDPNQMDYNRRPDFAADADHVIADLDELERLLITLA